MSVCKNFEEPKVSHIFNLIYAWLHVHACIRQIMYLVKPLVTCMSNHALWIMIYIRHDMM